MKKMKKILTILLLFLIFGTLIPSCISNTETTQVLEKQITLKTLQLDQIKNSKETLDKRYFIFGFGDIEGIYYTNKSWFIGGFYRGIYKADIIVENHPGMYATGYCFFIKDIQSGQLFNKTMLPEDTYLENFIGYVRAYWYSEPHGPYGVRYAIFGFADDFYEYEF